VEELEKVFQPAESELQFIAKKARGESQQLTLLTLLKSHQHLGYLPNIGSIPKPVWQYLSSQLGCDETVELMERTETNKKSFHRHYQSIRSFLGVLAWAEEGQNIVHACVKKAAFTMSNPPDLINVAMEKLIEQRYELPAFSTLSRMVGHIRQAVHLELFEKLNRTLKPEAQLILESLLQVTEEDTITGFTKIKEKPDKPTLQLMHKWIKRLEWLQQILDTSQLFEIIAPTKVQQFAAEIEQAETQDLLDMNAPKRYTHLVCLIHQKQVATKDELVELFLRRMRRTRIGAEKKLTVLQELSRHIEEQLLSIFSKVADYTLTISKDKKLGDSVRQLIETNGGAAHLLE
jgi:predicted nucleic acid-binding protein